MSMTSDQSPFVQKIGWSKENGTRYQVALPMSVDVSDMDTIEQIVKEMNKEAGEQIAAVVFDTRCRATIRNGE